MIIWCHFAVLHSLRFAIKGHTYISWSLRGPSEYWIIFWRCGWIVFLSRSVNWLWIERRVIICRRSIVLFYIHDASLTCRYLFHWPSDSLTGQIIVDQHRFLIRPLMSLIKQWVRKHAHLILGALIIRSTDVCSLNFLLTHGSMPLDQHILV